MNILITGITTGFGFLTAKKLLNRGHTLLSPVRGGWSRLENDLEFVKAKAEGRLIVVDLDLTQISQLDELKKRVDVDFKLRLDALIHNAGLGILMPFELQKEPDIRQQFDVNFFAPLELTRILLPALRFSKGRIICVSSIAGLVSFPYYSTYSASKFALEAWAESLASEIEPQGVRVSLVEPGGYVTEFSKRSRSRMEVQVADNLKEIYESTLIGFQRLLEAKAEKNQNPHDVANKIVQLTESRKPKFMNIKGIDAWTLYIASRMLPRSWLRRFLGVLFRLGISRFVPHKHRAPE